MKMNIRRKMIAMTLAAIMMAAPVSGTVFAADEVSLDQPDKPVAESYEDNDKIEDYNKKVDEYNQSAEEYNETVDKEYEAAVEETNRINEEIDQHNEAELQRVKEAEENNAKAIKEAEEANARIDEENAAEEARVNEHNAAEDEKVKASEEAIAAAEKENEEVKAHNEAAEEAAAQYEADKAKYEADLEQYKKDCAMEEKIKAVGYASVEQYNDTINKHYNEPANTSVEKNASAKAVGIGDTYTIKEAEEKSGVKIKVHIAHNFEGSDASFEENLEIDRNDIINLNSIAAVGNPTAPGYASFYYSTDEDHKMGYWVLGYEVLMDNAKYKNSNWNCGTSYEISYKDGANHVNDIEDIDIAYNYMWIPLKVYKTYNIPTAPTAPTAPAGPRAYVEVPDRYTPTYMEFTKKEYVKANVEEIEEANIIEKISAPVKKAYMSLLDHIALFDKPVETPEETPVAATVPETTPAQDTPAETPEEAPVAATTPEASPAQDTPAETPAATTATAPAPKAPVQEAPETVPATTAPTAPAAQPATATPSAPAAQTTPAVTATVQESQERAQTALITDQNIPMAELTETSPVTINDSQAPLADGSYWALLNLIMTIVTGIISAILLIGYFGKKNDEDENEGDEESETKRKGLARLASIIPAVGALIAFILTEDMSNPMILTDRWTILMAVILLIQAVVAIRARKTEEENDEVEAPETMNA